MRFTKRVILFTVIMLVYCSGYAQTVNQAAIDKQVRYFNSQIKKNSSLPEYAAQVTTITSSQYELQKPSDALSFDCGYLDNDGKVYVSAPSTDAQKKIFTDITEAAVYYVSQSFLRHFYQTNQIPMWFRVGFAAFEADLKIDDTMIKNAITSYGGSLPSFNTLNDRANFDANNGIAIAYLWGELMNVSFGWWKYYEMDSFTANSFTMPPGAKTPGQLFGIFSRYTNVRILETIERFRLKFQSESDHFKFYYRDNENYCMPYMQTAVEEAYLQYSTELNIQAPKKLTYSFSPECEGSKIDSSACPGRYTGGTAWASGLVTSCADKEADLYMFRNLARHELAHAFQFLIKPNYMPAWLSEGFASFLPDGVMSEQFIRNQSGFAVHKFEVANNKIGHYPTIVELEDYDFMGRNGLDYYLFGLIIHDFVVKKGGYSALANIVKSNGQDFSSLGYTTKGQFESGFYEYYNSTWQPKPKQLSIKKTNGKPRLDGITSEPVWEKNIVLDRKFWSDGSATNIPTIDNTVNASMLWDEENLYIAFDVLDGNISTEWLNFLRDGIEADIDPDLSRGIDFKNDDMAFIWTVNNTEPQYRTNLTGANVVSTVTSNGYNVEISIPWSKLGITPVAGKKFGLELCNYDRDNNVYKGAYIFSGHSWEGGVALNGLAEVTLSGELAKKSCQIITPNGGEVFVTGETETIDYNAFNVSNVKIEFSADNGATWSTITANATVSANGYNWLVPNIRTELGKIRITDLTDNTATSMSERTFKIVSPVSSFGPFLSDANTVLLMHFNNNLQNKTAAGNGTGTNISYSESANTNLGTSVKPQSVITIPHNNLLNLSSNFTIELWVKLSSFNPNGTTLLTKPGDNDAYFSNYTLEVNPWWGNIFHGFYFDQSNARIGQSGFTPQLNKWYHVAYIRDAGNKEVKIVIHDETRTQVYITKRNYTETASLLSNSKDLQIANGLEGYIDELRISNIVRDFTVGIENENKTALLPNDYSLMQNYPNPFNPSTKIKFSLPKSSFTRLIVYDALGKEVTTLINSELNAGIHEVEFNASHLSSGVYFYKIQSGQFNAIKKLVLLK